MHNSILNVHLLHIKEGFIVDFHSFKFGNRPGGNVLDIMDTGDRIGVFQLHLVSDPSLFKKFVQHECDLDRGNRALMRNPHHNRHLAAFKIAQAFEHSGCAISRIGRL